MRIGCLISYDKKTDTYKYLYADINTQLNDISEVNTKLVNKNSYTFTKPQDILLADSKVQIKLNYKKVKVVENKLVFEIEANKTKNSILKGVDGKDFARYTVVAICQNIVGERIAYACIDTVNPKGIRPILTESFIKMARVNNKFINNAFYKNGGIQFVDGNYIQKKNKNGEIESVPILPVIKIGTQFETDDKNIKKIDLKNVKKLKPPILAMLHQGYKNQINKYNLADPTIPDNNLWFYYMLLKSGKENYVAKLRTPIDFGWDQLFELQLCVQQGIDIQPFLDKSIGANEIRRVRENAKKGLKVIPLPKRAVELKEKIKKEKWQNKKDIQALNTIKARIAKKKGIQ